MDGWIENIDKLKEGIDIIKRIYPSTSIETKEARIEGANHLLEACVQVQLIVQLNTDYEMEVITSGVRGRG